MPEEPEGTSPSQSTNDSGQAGDAGGGDSDGSTKSPGSDTVSKEAFRGAMEKERQATAKRLDALKGEVIEGMESRFTSLEEKLSEGLEQLTAATAKSGDDKGGKKSPEEDAEFQKVKRRLDEIEKEKDQLNNELQSAKKQRELSTKRTALHDALRSAGCGDPEILSTYVLDDVSLGEDEKCYATVKNDLGGEDTLGMEEFAKVLKERYPRQFVGANRSGGPASGDSGGGPKTYTYDWLKVRDKPGIMNTEEFQKAWSEGKVANVPKSGASR